jgi:NAD(P)-dependent dehydrogenase (short-subunit alcohol dehydrogenase family)
MTDQRSILITGAASGIGRAAAVLFAQRGWLVGAADRDEAGLAALAGSSEGIVPLTLDVADRDAVVAAMAQFGEHTGGKLDCLLSNAGIDAKGPFGDMAWDRVRQVVEVNLLGAMSVIHAALQLLRVTPGSLCLSTASGSAIFGVGGMAVYSSTKHGVRGLTEALSVELSGSGVRAADLLPGIIDTGMLTAADKAALPTEGMWRVMPAEAVAQAAWDAYHGDKVHWFIPPELAELDRQSTAAPEAVRDALIARNQA